MTREAAIFLQDAADFNAIESRIDMSYSGRGMYEDTTYGLILTDPNVLLPAVIAYLKNNPDKLKTAPDLNEFRQDSLGRSVIIY